MGNEASWYADAVIAEAEFLAMNASIVLDCSGMGPAAVVTDVDAAGCEPRRVVITATVPDGVALHDALAALRKEEVGDYPIDTRVGTGIVDVLIIVRHAGEDGDCEEALLRLGGLP